MWAPTCPGANTTWLSHPRSTKRPVSCSWAWTAQCRSSGCRAEALEAHKIPVSRRAATTLPKEARPIAQTLQSTVCASPGIVIADLHRPSVTNTTTLLPSGLNPHPAPTCSTADIHLTLNSRKSEKEPAFSLSPLSSRRAGSSAPFRVTISLQSDNAALPHPRTIDFPDSTRASRWPIS